MQRYQRCYGRFPRRIRRLALGEESAAVTVSAMRANVLCREWMNRILSVLDRNGGTCSIRDFSRTYGVWNWEVEQAETAGWVCIRERKPAVGRPSFEVVKLNECDSAKLPPPRYAIPHELSIRHDRFAMESISVVTLRGAFNFAVQSATTSYLRAFPKCKSRSAAAASASRLMKRPMIRAARLWYRRIDSRMVAEPVPSTPAEIHRRLRELGKLS